MRVHGALLPGNAAPGQDRWTATECAAVVLDGASSFGPSTVDATQYVDALVTALNQRLTDCATEPLRVVLRDAISSVATALDLKPGYAPSSTVLIAWESGPSVHLLVLGDSTAIVKTTDGSLHRFTDDRLSKVAPNVRADYQRRLREGTGYDDHHRELLSKLQQEQAQVRNSAEGYWISEADERAADEAAVRTFPALTVDFCILATDGAQRSIDYLQVDWAELARLSAVDLHDRLIDLHQWEDSVDPDGMLLPRAKRHDDKAIVVCRPSHPSAPANP